MGVNLDESDGKKVIRDKWKLEVGSWNPDVKSGLRRLEVGRNKVSLGDGGLNWIPDQVRNDM